MAAPARTREDRVDDALSQLVERAVPQLDDEDDAEADERYYDALDQARDTLESHGPSTAVHDAAHISDIIQRRLIREHNNPDGALRFANLYNRLLAQPVLNQKGPILHLLNQLSDVPPSVAQSQRPADVRNRNLDDAFGRNGLSNYPDTRQATQPTPSRPTTARDFPRRNTGGGEDQELENPVISENATEHALLRDLPFLLQGISSTNFSFASTTETLKMPSKLPPPLIALLHSLAEPSLLYKGLAKFVDSSEGGLVGQSLRSAIGAELRSYLSLVATLEGQIRRALSQLNDTQQSSKNLGRAGVTLKRCVIWTREATLGLRLMSLIVDEAKSRKGGQIISLIHSFSSSHGDPFVSSFAERLLSYVTRPFYDMLRPWIYDGELSDPYLEFFVIENHSAEAESEAKGGATSVWDDKYKLFEPMIPSIITSEFARKIFLIGKSLNFIRYGCGDSAWVESYSKDASRELRYGDTATLESSIDSAYTTTMARLTELMNTKFHLQSHLFALKKYLLLGQGDFIALLMESLSTALDRPATSQYRHALTAQLEHAIRGSNAQFDSADVLRRLDARMLELSHGEVGWDVFTLEYKIDAPVDVIVTPHGSKQYLKVFNFLWRVKRVEYALGTTWRRSMTGARGVLGAVTDVVGSDWRAAHRAMAEMIHFVNQLQYYILFEVIESSWATLQRDMQRPGATLDDLIAAHARYLRSITRKGLLSSAGALDFPGQLHELLKIMLAYKDAVDGLYAASVAEYTRRQQRTARIDLRTKQGTWGVTEADDPTIGTAGDYDALRSDPRLGPRSRDIDQPFPPPLINLDSSTSTSTAANGTAAEANGLGISALRPRLAQLSTQFRARIAALLGDLAYQPDMELRFLGVVMNFNDTYKVIRRSKRSKEHAVGAGHAVGVGGERERDRDRRRERAMRERERERGGPLAATAATAPAPGVK